LPDRHEPEYNQGLQFQSAEIAIFYFASFFIGITKFVMPKGCLKLKSLNTGRVKTGALFGTIMP
jgi:hypothetical protein